LPVVSPSAPSPRKWVSTLSILRSRVLTGRLAHVLVDHQQVPQYRRRVR
jgi:hypothetical protein